MSDNSSSNDFAHERGHFDPAQVPGGSGVSDAEAKYAKLFAEVIWDGVITEEKRTRLETAAKMFGVSPARAEQIEQALTAAHEASHGEVVDETEAKERTSIAPLAPADDPGMQALQGRIHLLEQQVAELERENGRLNDLNEGLDELVTQLQASLDSTLEELDDVSHELEEREEHIETYHRTGEPPPRSERFDDDEKHDPVSSVQPVPSAPAGMPEPARTEPGAGPPPAAQAARAEAPASRSAPDLDVDALGTTPIPPDTNRGYQSPDGQTVVSAVDTTERQTKKRWRSRRVIRESQQPPAVIEMKRRRENPAEIHKLICQRPRDAELLHRLFASLQRGEDLDRRWCIASALVYLGESNDQEREVYVDYAVAGLVKPTRAVNDDEWRELLFHPDEDPTTGDIFGAIAPAVLLGHMTAIRASIAPELIDASRQIDPAKSKLDAARCMSWAAAALGMELPPLYAVPEHEGVADVVLNPSPSLRLSKQALVGRSNKELAYIAGSTLSWCRKEHMLGRPSRSVRRLEDMFLAALMIGNPGLPMAAEIKARVAPMVKTILPLLDGEATAALQKGFSRFVEQGGRTNLTEWYRAAERTAACAGLLLSNDLHAAQAVLDLERASATEAPENTVFEAMNELIVFFTAGRCSLLRKRIGIAVQAPE